MGRGCCGLTGGGSVATVTTFTQPIDETLAPSADAIGIPAEPYAPPSTAYDGNDWLTGQRLSGGSWWLAGTNKLTINEFMVNASGKSTRRTLVTHGGAVLATSQFESFKYGDELWLGFVDASSSKEQPFRILRVKPECTYKSMFNLIGG